MRISYNIGMDKVMDILEESIERDGWVLAWFVFPLDYLAELLRRTS